MATQERLPRLASVVCTSYGVLIPLASGGGHFDVILSPDQYPVPSPSRTPGPDMVYKLQEVLKEKPLRLGSEDGMIGLGQPIAHQALRAR